MVRLILVNGTSAKLYEDDIKEIKGNTIYTNDGDYYELNFDRYIDITDRKITLKEIANNGIVSMSEDMYKLFEK